MRLVLRRKQVENVSFCHWYDLFSSGKGRRATIRSIVLDLPLAVRDYLGQDGIVLPKPPGALRPRDPRCNRRSKSEDWESASDSDDERAAKNTAANSQSGDQVGRGASDDEDGCEGGTSDLPPRPPPCFADFERQVEQAITDLKDEAFVKLNWSSPQDAEWMQGTLKCYSPGDLFLLLKSSSFIQHDLNHAFDNCVDRGGDFPGKVVLRRWSNLDKACEFRCFVYNRRLVAVAQRYPQHYYEFLSLEHDTGRAMLDSVSRFIVEEKVAETFPDEHFVVDVYVDRQSRVWIIDFGTLPEMLSPCCDSVDWDAQLSERLLSVPPHELLSWDDLASLIDPSSCAEVPSYRVVKSQKESQSYGDINRSHRVPVELVTGELTHQVIDEINKQLDAL